MFAGRHAAVIATLLVLVQLPTAPAAAQPETVVGVVDVMGTILAKTRDGSGLSVQTSETPGAVTVLVHATTVLTGAPGSHRHGGMSAIARLLQSGDTVRVGGFRLSGGRVLALNLRLLNRPLDLAVSPVLTRFPTSNVVAEGVVADTRPDGLVLVGVTGIRHVPLPVSTPAVGARLSLHTIKKNDIVRIERIPGPGHAASGARVIVVFAAATPVHGVVMAAGDVGTPYLILGGFGLAGPARIAVRVGSGARLVRDNGLRQVRELRIGTAVTVYGTAITAGSLVSGGQVIAIDAKVIDW